MDRHADAASAHMQAVGRRVAELRRRGGWTQDDLATALGVTVVYVQRIERGANLTIRSLVRVAAALDVSVSDLFAAPVSLERVTGRPRRSATH
jgi:transcriptional regulator with XRE-family HTH domain